VLDRPRRGERMSVKGEAVPSTGTLNQTSLILSGGIERMWHHKVSYL